MQTVRKYVCAHAIAQLHGAWLCRPGGRQWRCPHDVAGRLAVFVSKIHMPARRAPAGGRRATAWLTISAGQPGALPSSIFNSVAPSVLPSVGMMIAVSVELFALSTALSRPACWAVLSLAWPVPPSSWSAMVSVVVQAANVTVVAVVVVAAPVLGGGAAYHDVRMTSLRWGPAAGLAARAIGPDINL